MTVSMHEPLTARYIYINPETNQVHVLLPIVGGIEIGTDNTCKSAVALKTFFARHATTQKNANSALNILNSYKAALEHDIAVLPSGHTQKNLKIDRLAQIKSYIAALTVIQGNSEFDSLYLSDPKYPNSIRNVIQNAGNLYAMTLRPGVGLDTHTHAIKSVFSVRRADNEVLYKALDDAFINFSIPRTRKTPINKVKDKIKSLLHIDRIQSQADYVNLQAIMTQELQVDFTITNQGLPATKDYIDQQMGSFDLTVDEYIDSLIGFCSINLAENLDSSPFMHITDRDQQQLIVMTQFFLGEVNIYCVKHSISQENFGLILDKNSDLSEQLASIVKMTIEQGGAVEAALINFLNQHATEFNLSRVLEAHDSAVIFEKFTDHYTTVKDIESPDEFMIADPEIPGKIVTHQGSLCIDLTEVIASGYSSQNNPYFDTVRQDFSGHSFVIPNVNDEIAATLNIEEQQIPEYLADLIERGHAKHVIDIVKDNNEILRRLPENSLEVIFNSADKNGVSLLQYAARDATEDFASLASILSEQQLVAFCKQKNNRGDNLIHYVLNKPQKLTLVLESLPQESLSELLEEKNARNETVLQAARNQKSLQIVSDITRMRPSPTPMMDVQASRMPGSQPTQIPGAVTRVSTKSRASSQASNSSATTNLSQDASPRNSSRSSTPESRGSSVSSSMRFFKPTPLPSASPTSHLEFLSSSESEGKECMLYLNKSIEAIKDLGARNCLVWQIASGKELAYIDANGDVTTVNMKITKLFTFKAYLQKLTREQGDHIIEDSCDLNLNRSELTELMQQLGPQAGDFHEQVLNDLDVHGRPTL